jgi:hypothetical protein
MNAPFGAIEPGLATHKVIREIAASMNALFEGDVTDREFLKAYDTSVESLSALHWMLASSALEAAKERLSEEAIAEYQQNREMRFAMENEEATELRYTELIQRLAIPIPPQISAMGEFLRKMIEGEGEEENG